MTEGLISLARLLLGLASLTLVGFLPLSRLAPELRRSEALAAGFGIGALVLTLWMLALSSLGLKFRLLLVAVPPLLVAGVLGLLPSRKEARSRPNSSAPDPPWSGWDWFFLGCLGVLLALALLRAALYPLWAWDAVATWGFKGKVFYLRGTIDLSGFEAHNYYPNLVPLTLTYLYLWLGQVHDHLGQVLFPVWGASLLLLFFSLLRHLGLPRPPALGVTAFLALNGVTFITHLYIAYADLALTYFVLGAAGYAYLWLRTGEIHPWLVLAALYSCGLAWTKFEGLPLAGSLVLAAVLTLIWLRPPSLGVRMASVSLLLGGMLLGYVPWKLYAQSQGIETGADHILGFYPHQMLQALGPFLQTLFHPRYFGLLWPVFLAALLVAGRSLWTTFRLFPVLYLGGNLLAILLAYGVAPTSPFEFHLYLRATLDRLLLHLTPLAALLVGEALKDCQTGQVRRILPGR